jgi:hypothetical protein
VKTYSPEHYAANKELYAEYHRRYREKHKDRVKESNRRYRQLNKDKRAALERMRRARKRNSLTEKYSVEDVLAKYGSNCHLCGMDINLTAERRPGRKGWEWGLHIDHLVEISSGGSDTLENVRPAHGLCNLKRNNKKLMNQETN